MKQLLLAAYFKFIVGLLSAWGYLAVVIGMALESACMPVPSELVLPFAGYLVSRGDISFLEAVTAGLLGGMIGSVASYWVGRSQGRDFILKYGRRFLINEKNMARADAWVAKYGDKAAFWARFFPVVRTFISLPLGIARMDFKRFFLYSLAGSLPWTLVLVYGGKVLGENWEKVSEYGDWYDLAIICSLTLALLYLGIKKYRQRKK